MDKPRAMEDVNEKIKPWQLTEVLDPANCRMVTMPDSTDAGNKVCERNLHSFCLSCQILILMDILLVTRSPGFFIQILGLVF